jgi:hypothetical protein
MEAVISYVVQVPICPTSVSLLGFLTTVGRKEKKHLFHRNNAFSIAFYSPYNKNKVWNSLHEK